MAVTLLLPSLSSPTTWKKKFEAPRFVPSSLGKRKRGTHLGRAGGVSRDGVVRVEAFFNPFEDQPIIKDALKEPVAFMGGMFAGLLRLDLNEEPLKEWVARTVESSGITTDEEVGTEVSRLGGEEDGPQQIEIE